MNKWQTALTTNPSVANAVGMILDLVDNCNCELSGSLVNDGEKITTWIETDDNIVVPLQVRYATKQG